MCGQRKCKRPALHDRQVLSPSCAIMQAIISESLATFSFTHFGSIVLLRCNLVPKVKLFRGNT